MKVRRTIDSERFVEQLMKVVEAADGPKDVAYHVDISLSAVYNYMSGRIPSTGVMLRLAQYAGVPVEWFFAHEDEDVADANLRVGTVSFAEGSTPSLKVQRAA